MGAICDSAKNNDSSKKGDVQVDKNSLPKKNDYIKDKSIEQEDSNKVIKESNINIQNDAEEQKIKKSSMSNNENDIEDCKVNKKVKDEEEQEEEEDINYQDDQVGKGSEINQSQKQSQINSQRFTNTKTGFSIIKESQVSQSQFNEESYLGKSVQKDFQIPINRKKVNITITNQSIGSKWEKDYSKDSDSKIKQSINNSNRKNVCQSILNDFYRENRISRLNKIEFKQDGKQIDENNLEFIISENDNIKLEAKILGLTELADDYYQAFQEKTKIIAKPFISKDNIELIILDRSQNTIKNKKFNFKKIKDFNEYSISYAVCNGDNKFFLSGGEDQTQSMMDEFIIIDLYSDTNLESDFKMPVTRANHAMIYIPNKYVFIVGGQSRKVYYFDTENKNFFDWGLLNEDRKKCSLCYINDQFLYVFSNENTKSITFEKSDLRNVKKWEKISPLISSNAYFSQKDFSLCYNKLMDKIIFFGGEKVHNDQYKVDNTKCLAYSVNENMIDYSDVPFKEDNMLEKTFVPLRSNYHYLFPDCERSKIMIYVYHVKDNIFKNFNYGNLNANKGIDIDEEQDEEDYKGKISSSVIDNKNKHNKNGQILSTHQSVLPNNNYRSKGKAMNKMSEIQEENEDKYENYSKYSSIYNNNNNNNNIEIKESQYGNNYIDDNILKSQNENVEGSNLTATQFNNATVYENVNNNLKSTQFNNDSNNGYLNQDNSNMGMPNFNSQYFQGSVNQQY